MSKGEDRVATAFAEVAEEAFATARLAATAALAGLADEPEPTSAMVAQVEAAVRPALERRAVQGAGFVAAPGLLADHEWWLEWFVTRADAVVERLQVQTEPAALGFYDYRSYAWYRVPHDSGRPHVTGPYVDHMCTEDYALTFSMPVLRGQTDIDADIDADIDFVGIAGVDVSLASMERRLLPHLRAEPGRVAVVNDERRVVVSNSAALMCGTRADADELAAAHSRTALADLPIEIVRWG
ncbi:MAG: cache domain-containing protein [Nocardioides sp.]|uniref:cache domain-containing protein n=1 Tax=Nocardioides sp. TaxID=35761 RepID=UPI0039E32E2E